MGGTFNVQLVARSDIEKSNLFSAKITFPTNELSVQSIDFNTNSFIPQAFQVEHVFNNTIGTISIVGGAAPALQTNSTDLPSNMATIIFKRIGPDTAILHFTPSTQTDNNQTGIFSNSTNQNILVSSPDLTLTDQNTPTPTPPVGGDYSEGNYYSQGNYNSSYSEGTYSIGTSTGSGNGDIDGNSKIDVFDLSTLLRNWAP